MLRSCGVIVELGPLIAAPSWAKPRRISGRCAMISCELGTNPMRFFEFSSCSASSGIDSGGSGARRGMFPSSIQDQLLSGERGALGGCGQGAEILAEAIEWNYGHYEGLRTAGLQGDRPGWVLFRDGCARGEAAAQVGARADRVIARLRATEGDVLLFSSAHFLRV